MNDLNSVLIEGVVTQPFGYDGESVKPLTMVSRSRKGEMEKEIVLPIVLTTTLAGQIGEELKGSICGAPRNKSTSRFAALLTSFR